MRRPSKGAIRSAAARLPRGVGGLAVYHAALGAVRAGGWSLWARQDARASQSERNIRALYRAQLDRERAARRAQAPTFRSRLAAVANLVRPMWLVNRAAENGFVDGWLKTADVADTLPRVEAWELISDPDSFAEQQRDAARLEERVATMGQRRRVARVRALIDAEQSLPVAQPRGAESRAMHEKYDAIVMVAGVRDAFRRGEGR